MKIYIAHPISGKGYAEVVNYMEETKRVLTHIGYEVLHPMTGKGFARTEKIFRAHGNEALSPITSNHAIVTRDFWMVNQADIIYVNLLSATEPSLGCVAEIAWAYATKKLIVVAMQDGNPHNHAFIYDMASIIFDDNDDVLNYLNTLKFGRI